MQSRCSSHVTGPCDGKDARAQYQNVNSTFRQETPFTRCFACTHAHHVCACMSLQVLWCARLCAQNPAALCTGSCHVPENATQVAMLLSLLLLCSPLYCDSEHTQDMQRQTPYGTVTVPMNWATPIQQFFSRIGRRWDSHTATSDLL